MMSKHLNPFCFLLLTLVPLIFGCVVDNPKSNINQTQEIAMNQSNEKHETATFGAGCFWCVEAVYQNLKGVQKVVSGYAGGKTPNPTYKQICTGQTGHAEVAQITYDPNQISYQDLLDVFWNTHDPTTLNRQGADTGTQYRSVIFYNDDHQKEIAEQAMAETDASGLWSNPIVTEISPIPTFYPAEDYHQNYYQSNPSQPYCTVIISPKIQKLKKEFKHILNE
jgi:peptide-methionine (S)-S-oxide reductase